MKAPIYKRKYDYDKKLLPNAHVARLEEGVTDIDGAVKKTGLTIGYPGWNLLYYTVLCSLREDRFNLLLETGTNWGFSAIMMAQALKDSGYAGKLHTVELKEENAALARDNIKAAGVADLVDSAVGDSLTYLKEFVKRPETVVFAFLDGCHDEEHLVEEFTLLHPRLDHKSTVFFDNTYLIQETPGNRRVNGALKRIKASFGGNLVNFENSSWFTPGQAIWQADPFREDWNY